MNKETATELIEVQVVYPSAHGPVRSEFPPTATVREVKEFALREFNLREDVVGGNQIVFFLFFDRQKLEDLNATLGSFLHDSHQRKLNFRLAKEIIAG